MNKSILLIFIFVSLMFNLSAQRCNLLLDETDTFTGEKIRLTSPLPLASTFARGKINVQLESRKVNSSEKVTLVLKFVNRDELNMNFKRDQKLLLKLSNDSIVALSCSFDKNEMLYNRIWKNYYIENEYIIPGDKINLLKEYPIILLRLYYFNPATNIESEKNFDSKDLGSVNLMEIFKCLEK